MHTQKQIIKEWKYGNKMESMNDKELSKRIKEVMDLKLDHQIRPIPYVGKADISINYNYKELVARCPVTGILDTYKLNIKITPDKLIPELKSLKFYLMDYDPLPISHEHLAAKIAQDIVTIINPKEFNLSLSVAVRGGIKTNITYEVR